MPRPVHFEIHADDPDRASDFYKKSFNWEINKWDGNEDYWLIKTGEQGEPGIDGAITRRSPGLSTVNTVSVDSVDDYTRRIEDAGGKVLMPKMAVPGVGYMAYFADTEGNMFGIMQMDESAA